MCKLPLYLCVLIVTIAAIGNLVRFLMDIQVTIGTVAIPNWTGAVAFLVLGAIAVWACKALCPSCCHPSDRL